MNNEPRDTLVALSQVPQGNYSRLKPARHRDGKIVWYKSHYTQAIERLHGLTEEHSAISVPSYGSVDRQYLPQIKYDEFMDDMYNNGVDVTDQHYPPEQLKPTQAAFDESKVLDLMKDPDSLDKPIIVSSDHHIIDGHHRWLAAHNLRKQKIACRQVNMPVDELLDHLLSKDYSTFKPLDESVVSHFADVLQKVPRLRSAMDSYHTFLKTQKPGIAVNKAANLHGISPRLLQDLIDGLQRPKAKLVSTE